MLRSFVVIMLLDTVCVCVWNEYLNLQYDFPVCHVSGNQGTEKNTLC